MACLSQLVGAGDSFFFYPICKTYHRPKYLSLHFPMDVAFI